MTIMKNGLSIILIFQIILCSTSITYGGNSQQNCVYDLQKKIDSIAIKNKIPGLVMGIVSQDTILINYNYGFSNLEEKINVNSNTKFRVGSITKSFLALGFLKLVEEGKINLETTVESIAPEILIENKWEATNPVRIVNLLEHTAGFDDVHYVNDTYAHILFDLGSIIEAIKYEKKAIELAKKEESDNIQQYKKSLDKFLDK